MISNVIGIVVSNVSGIMQANDAFKQMLGFTRAEFITNAVNWEQIIPPQHQSVDQRAIAQVKTDGACILETEYLDQDGNTIPVVVGISTLVDAENEYVCFALDLTERLSAEANLKTSMQALELPYSGQHNDKITN